MIVDFRSDTVTKPSKAMRDAMANAPVGDDVFGEDPTVNELQKYASDLFGMEAALYCSSGTQTNQIAINVHTHPGDEVICSSLAHVYLYEGGGIAQNSGCSVRLLEGNQGKFSVQQVESNINNPSDSHLPLTSLVCIEDTMNKGGGAIWEYDQLKAISDFCRKKNLAIHCDGARLFNALIENKIAPSTYGELFDSISICLSKGLGAPVGSLLLGTKAFIHKAHRRRKSFGGGMRQAGIIAAAGLYALQNNVERLKDDHKKAHEMASIFAKLEWVKEIMPVQTNIVIAELVPSENAYDRVKYLAEKGILTYPFGKDKIRLVTHLDISDEMIEWCRTQLQ